MNDPRNILQEKFKEQHRYANFGPVIIGMHLKGFRCHSDTVIEINSPIAAFCGLNGTGKSTLLQLAATAYKKPDNRAHQYYMKDFMVVSALDPSPFADDANVEYKLWQEDRTPKKLRISRSAVFKKWRGYKGRRIVRKVFFAGVGLYLPKVERRDFTVRNASRFTVSDTLEVGSQIREWTCKILGKSYENIFSNTVTHIASTGIVISVLTSGVRYSESHMGYGEARSQNLINILETLPNKSLVLIEEPETSLHPSAQFQFGKYLIDVSIRKGHQILLTTHSEFILQALPSASRIYLHKISSGIEAIPGLTAQQAKSLMADGHVKALHILVEDECAKAILSNIIYRFDPTFRRSVGIYAAGSEDTIAKTVRTLRATNLPVVAVRDGDMSAQPSENIFKLPGVNAPEKEMFANSAVTDHVSRKYGINLNDFAAELSGTDHHEWLAILAQHIDQTEQAIIGELADIYSGSVPESEASPLVNLLKESVRR